MAKLYLRKVVLDVLPEGGSGRRIDQLRIRFKVEKTNESHPNTALIEVFNLSDSSRGLLESDKTRLVLSVGYEDTAEVIFQGDVTKAAHKNTDKKNLPVTHHSDGPDIITTLEVADGDNRFRNARLSKGYPPTTTLKAVIDDCQTELGLGKGTQEGIPDKAYSQGWSHSGLVRDALNDLCRANDLEWSIQNERLQIVPKASPTSEGPILLSAVTGLVGSPNKTAKGVEFISLIQPRLQPARQVSIDSRLVKGTFKIQRVVHEGDAHRGTFYSKCEATA